MSLARRMSSALVLGIGLCACEGVPEAYRGRFLDQATGAQLKVDKGEVRLEAGGRQLKQKLAKVEPQKVYEKLLKGESGAFVQQDGDRDRFVDVYWIMPDLATRRSEGGLVWGAAHVLYVRIDREAREKVSSLEVIQAPDAVVLLDTQTRRWQAGWPERTRRMEMVRIGK